MQITYIPTKAIDLQFPFTYDLLVDPSKVGRSVLDEFFLLKPESNFSLGTFDTVRTMSNVSTNIDSKVTTDSTRSRLKRVSSTEDGSTLLNNVLTFPDGSKNRTRSHVFEKTREKWLGLKILIVFSQKSFRGLGKLDGNKLETSVLESRKDRGNKTSLNTVGLLKLVTS